MMNIVFKAVGRKCLGAYWRYIVIVIKRFVRSDGELQMENIYTQWKYNIMDHTSISKFKHNMLMSDDQPGEIEYLQLSLNWHEFSQTRFKELGTYN